VDAARKILEKTLKILEDAGAFSVVLECVPEGLGHGYYQRSFPFQTIGIGAGFHCDGQVLVLSTIYWV
jgi:3-methyl-2-oxobutanoate hydroxymethyltransferase